MQPTVKYTNCHGTLSKTKIHETATSQLGKRKLCSRWVPKMLTDDHKTKRLVSALKFLTRYAKKEMSFWAPLPLEMKHGVFTTLLNPSNSHCDGTICIQPEPKYSKLQFQWKNMASVFWDKKGILLVDFMPPGATVNAAAYRDTLTRIRRVIQSKRRGMLSRGVCLLHDTLGHIPPTSPLHLCKNSSGSYWTIRRTVGNSRQTISTCFFT